MEREEYLRLIREWTDELIPFNKFLGIRVVDVGNGACTLTIPYRPELIGDPWRPAIHGGLIATLVDTAGGMAVFTAVTPGDRVSTVDMRVDYLRRAQPADLHARGEVTRIGNRVATTNIRVWQDDDNKLVAEGRAVFNIKRKQDETDQGGKL
ncbi:MAG: hypothetical protein GMKNLPBB_01871 [Myxococcota bacterium]|nr:hypothetical protein [Myxococcota bacterium]